MKTYSSLQTVTRALTNLGYTGPAIKLPAPGNVLTLEGTNGKVYVQGLVSRCLKTGKQLWSVFSY